MLYFLQHPGRLITREELIDTVWRGRIVEDTSLRLAVNALRKALHDDSKTPRYILTACRRGYRFLPDVTVEAGFRSSVKSDQAGDLHNSQKNDLPDAPWHYDVELGQLLQAFQQAVDGARRLVFLDGEKSSGKTKLLERFLTEISHTELAALRARCVQLAGAAEPFLPLLEALERRCRKPCTYDKLLIDCLRRIAPTWLYQLSTILEPEEFAVLHLKVSQLGTGRMLREGADLIETLGTHQPLILILDNSHWSDVYTLDLVNFLASRCSPTRLLMILSFRPDENCPGARRLEEMREELRHRGIVQELSLRRNCWNGGTDGNKRVIISEVPPG